jgi:hypothetical protein
MASYAPSMDMGAFVVVINAEQVTVTGKKTAEKTYFRHVNARPGSWRIESFEELQRVRGREGFRSCAGEQPGAGRGSRRCAAGAMVLPVLPVCSAPRSSSPATAAAGPAAAGPTSALRPASPPAAHCRHHLPTRPPGPRRGHCLTPDPLTPNPHSACPRGSLSTLSRVCCPRAAWAATSGCTSR